jgi:signal recognition particle subunit SEC65
MDRDLLIDHCCWGLRAVGSTAAIGFGIASQAVPYLAGQVAGVQPPPTPDPTLGQAGIWIGISGLVTALGGLLIPIIKMYFDHLRAERDERRVEREDRWKRHDLANRTNDLGLTVAHLEATLSPAEFEEIKRRLAITEKMARRNTRVLDQATGSGLLEALPDSATDSIPVTGPDPPNPEADPCRPNPSPPT